MENSRIIIDTHTFNVYGAPGGNLGLIEPDSNGGSIDEQVLAGTHNVIFSATTQAFQKYQNALGRHEKRAAENLLVGCKSASYLFTSTRTTFNNNTSQNLKSQITFALHPSRTWLLPCFQNMG